MANYNTLISAIQSVIAENGNNEITGNILQQTLVAMIGALGGGYQFGGIATPQTTPGTPDEKIFYLGSSGTYPNFGPAVIPSGNMGVFWYDTSWHVGTIEFPIGEGTITETNLSTGLLEEILAGFVYMGKATPNGQPGILVRDSFFLTTTSGNYTNFGGLTVQTGEIAVLRYTVSTDTWNKESIEIPEMVQVVDNLIDGGSDKALSAEMGKYIGSRLDNLEVPKFITGIDISLYTKFIYFINSLNVWQKATNYQTSLIRLVPGHSYRVIAGTANNVIAILSSAAISAGQTPSFATGFTGRIPILAGETYEFTAPENGYYCYIVYSVDDIVRDTQFIAINEIETAHEMIVGEVPIEYSSIAVNGINYADGSVIDPSPTLCRTNYIDITGVFQIRYARCAGTSTTNEAGIAFFNENQNYIAGQRVLLGQPVNHVYEDTILNVPPRAKYVRFTLWTDNVQSFYAYDTNGNNVKSRISILENVSIPFKKLKLVANGDSIMYGSGIDIRGQVFPMLIAEKYGMDAINYAIGGSVVARRASDYDEVFLDYTQWQQAIAGGTLDITKKYLVKDNLNVPVRPYHIYSYSNGNWVAGGNASYEVGRTPLVDRINEMDADADIVLISIGSNDWAYMWTDYGLDTSRQRTDFCGALHLTCQQLLTRYRDKLILFITPPFSWRYQPSGVSMATWNMTTWNAESPTGKTWWDYLNTMKEILLQYGIPILDLGAELGFSQFDTWWCADVGGSHVHPNVDAQPLIAGILARKLGEYMKL